MQQIFLILFHFNSIFFGLYYKADFVSLGNDMICYYKKNMGTVTTFNLGIIIALIISPFNAQIDNEADICYIKIDYDSNLNDPIPEKC